MLRHVLYDLTLFGPGDDHDQTRKDLCWLMESLVARNQSYLKAHPGTPRLYRSGVKYEVPKQFEGECREVRVLRDSLGAAVKKPEVAKVLDEVQEALGGERFRDIGRIIENGGGDCDNLASWRVAELRQAGIKAEPCLIWRKRPDGGTTYHALVLWPPMGSMVINGQTVGDGGKATHEDPSLLLGMSQPQRAADRTEEIRKNKERAQILAAKKGGQSIDLDVLTELLGLHRPRPLPEPLSERDRAMALGRNWR